MNSADFLGKAVTEDLILRAGTREIEGMNANALIDQGGNNATRVETAAQVSNRSPVLPDSARHGGLKAFVNFLQMRLL